MLTIQQIAAMTPEQRRVANQKLEKQLMKKFIIFFGLKIALLVGIRVLMGCAMAEKK